MVDTFGRSLWEGLVEFVESKVFFLPVQDNNCFSVGWVLPPSSRIDELTLFQLEQIETGGDDIPYCPLHTAVGMTQDLSCQA